MPRLPLALAQRSPRRGRRCAFLEGFSLHAEHLGARARQGRAAAAVQLRRSRPPLPGASVASGRREGGLPDEAPFRLRGHRAGALCGSLPPAPGRPRPAAGCPPRPLLSASTPPTPASARWWFPASLCRLSSPRLPPRPALHASRGRSCSSTPSGWMSSPARPAQARAGWWPASSAPPSRPASLSTCVCRPGRSPAPAPRTLLSSSCPPDVPGAPKPPQDWPGSSPGRESSVPASSIPQSPPPPHPPLPARLPAAPPHGGPLLPGPRPESPLICP